MEGQTLVFRADGHLCALALDDVLEVMRPLPVEPLADAPPFVRGLSVVHGESVPVVGLADLIGGAGGAERRFVTVREGGRPVALAVDDVVGVRQIPAESLRELPSLLGAATAQAVAALGTLDAEPLLFLHRTRIVPDAVWAAV
jgi:purine-binding chemotaxis protein CheW